VQHRLASGLGRRAEGEQTMTSAGGHPGARAPVIVTMADTVPAREVAEVIGIARGSVVRARFFRA